MPFRPSLLTIVFFLLISSCTPLLVHTNAPATAEVSAPSPTAAMAAPTLTPTEPPVRASAVPLPTSTFAPRLCSPLQNQAIDQLPAMVSNPYAPPPPGSDDPHQGVDLSIRLADSQVAVAGDPVQAALAGRVAAVVRDRFPYGNAVIVETSLESSEEEWWLPAGIPTAAPTLQPRSALTCPPSHPLPVPDPSRRSLYVLYAHLAQLEPLELGEEISCARPLGTVGSSGNALNPHLHFETRVGPAGLQLSSMAHYDASASLEEMSTYCTWRISGLFQLVDPLKVLALFPGANP